MIAVMLCLSLCVPAMADETYTVGICQLVQHPALDAATQGFVDALKAEIPDVEIDIQNAADPEFEYLDRFTVKMGPNENTDYKLRMLLSAVMEMDANLMGTVDLSEGTAVHVSPD